MSNINMIPIGSNIVGRWKLTGLSREDTQREAGETVLRMSWKVQDYPKRMRSLGLKGGELKRQRVNKGSPGK